ncbi:MAG: helix-turn-helix transcriptional regulator [Candidatus Competibacteraceae bacterium]
MENWLDVLRDRCERTSQADVARRLGVSAALVNQAVRGLYKGDLERLQTLVEGVLSGQTVTCPVIGPLLKNKCLEHQERERRFATANPLKAQLYRACRSGCPHSKLTREY